MNLQPLKGSKIDDMQQNNSPLGVRGNIHVCCIGAVFDFYAGTVERAPKLFIKLGLEWFYRLIKEPCRMWRRYLIGNVKFVGAILKEWVMIRGK